MLTMEVSRMARATDPVGGRFPSQAKKKLIATHANSEIAATYSKHTYITISNRNTKPSSAIAIFLHVFVANPARALAANRMHPTLSAHARLTPPERGCYIELFEPTGEVTLISRRSIWMASLAAVALFACGCAVSKKTVVKPGQAPGPLLTATKGELIERY